MLNISNIALSIKDNLNAINFLNRWHLTFDENNKFYYEYYKIYENVIIIDVKSFNIVFLKYINRFIKSDLVEEFILFLESLPKDLRVVNFGYLFRELNKYNINLTNYLIAVRNIIFYKFIQLYKVSYRTIDFHRINYDDIEFNISNHKNFNTESFVTKEFLNDVKFNIIDNVVVLNKKNGVFYLKDSKIVDIKYNSGWVNVPINKYLLTEVLNFVISSNINVYDLQFKLNEIIEYTSNEEIFGYEDDQLSKSYNKNDNVPLKVKKLFIANIMSRFIPLFNSI